MLSILRNLGYVFATYMINSSDLQKDIICCFHVVAISLVSLFQPIVFNFFKTRLWLRCFSLIESWLALLEKCPYSEFSGPYFPLFGLNTEWYFASLCIQTECGKIWTRKFQIRTYFMQCKNVSNVRKTRFSITLIMLFLISFQLACIQSKY